MAKISLREYDREIERMVDSGETDEAIAHCKYILNQYPKHVNTYRLLGKAYLEDQRYGDATDVLQRILSSLPDDFVSQVGMSIIREDEGNLDQAIWHMERAFEVQPANQAIQEELRRLYGRRDGVEPPKIRLTRGALARMYYKGGLYPQAIAELRAALNDQPDRLDLQALLAKAYNRAGQRVEAAETATSLLRKLPNSLEGNQILAEILAASEREAEAQAYRQRVIALEPYAAFLKGQVLQAEEVDAEAITIERLDWAPDAAAGPTWAASLGVKVNESEPAESTTGAPEWMAAAADEPPDQQPGSSENLPDWLQAAGWGASDTAAGQDQPAGAPSADWMQKQPAEAEILPAEPGVGSLFETDMDAGDIASQEDIPDWLKSIAPEAVSGSAAGEPSAPAADDWLAEFSAAPSSSAPDWLSESTAQAPPAAPVDLPADEMPADSSQPLPDWLQETPADDQPGEAAFSPLSDGEAPAEARAPLPDWMKELADSDDDSGQDSAENTTGELPAEPGQPLPDWLQETGAGDEPAFAAVLGEPPAEPGEPLPDWLQEMAAEHESYADALASTRTDEPVAGDSQAIPEWLQENAAGDEPALAAVMGQPPAGPGEPLPDWLKEAAAGESEPVEDLTDRLMETEPAGALEEQAAESTEQPLAVQAATQADQPAAELTGQPPAAEAETQTDYPADALAEQPLAAEAEMQAYAEVVSAEQATGEVVAFDLDGDDAAYAWLESLAVKQGATEALLLDPNERRDDAPEWVKDEEAAGEALPPESVDETVAWAKNEEAAGGAQDFEIPDWLQEAAASEREPAEDLTPRLASSKPASAAESSDDLTVAEPAPMLPDWLQEPGIAEDEAVEMPAEAAGAVSPSQPEEERALPEPGQGLPEWLQDEISTEPEPEAPEPTAKLPEDEPLPDWLTPVIAEQSSAAVDGELAEAAVPDSEVIEEAPVSTAGRLDALQEPTSLADRLDALEEPIIEGDTRPIRIQPEQKAAELPTDAEAPQTGAEIRWPGLEPLTPASMEESPAVTESELSAGEDEPSFVEPTTELEPGFAPADQGGLAADGAEMGTGEEEVQDLDAAFAWLESLAVKQGAEEALLLAPEERLENAPDWVQAEEADQEAGSEQEALPEAGEPLLPVSESFAEEPAPLESELQQLAGEPPVEEPVMLDSQIQQATEEPAIGEPTVDSEIRQAAEEPAIGEPSVDSEIRQAAEEPAVASGTPEQHGEQPPESVAPDLWMASAAAAAPEPTPVEALADAVIPEAEEPAATLEAAPAAGDGAPDSADIPDLPSWLADLPAQVSEESEAWLPPEGLLPAIPEVEFEGASLDLNRASLNELERLPGMGFIMAQRIIMHRETNGAFASLDGLLEVPGFTPALLEELSGSLQVESQPGPAMPAWEDVPADLLTARAALDQGELDAALEGYSHLLQSGAHVEDILHDLQDAVYHHPHNINAWIALGDAYNRLDKPQEALDAYIHAQGLL